MDTGVFYYCCVRYIQGEQFLHMEKCTCGRTQPTPQDLENECMKHLTAEKLSEYDIDKIMEYIYKSYFDICSGCIHPYEMKNGWDVLNKLYEHVKTTKKETSSKLPEFEPGRLLVLPEIRINPTEEV